MVRYFYAWIPVVILFGGLVIAVSAALALVAFEVVVLVALAALVRAGVAVTHVVSRAVSHDGDTTAGTAAL
jgi:hypothetical protein